MSGIFESKSKLKVGDLVQDIFTKEVGLVIEVIKIDESPTKLYRVLLQNPITTTYPTCTYGFESLKLLVSVSR